MEHEDFNKIRDLLKEKKFEKKSGRNLNKIQRLALEIIKDFNIPKEMQGRWFKICKKYPAFLEDNFIRLKNCANVKNPAACLWSIIHPKLKKDY